MTEPDIQAVRALPPAMADPTDDAVARTWNGMTRLDAWKEQAARPVARGWLIPVMAAVAVGVLAVSTAVLLKQSGGAQFEPGANATVLDIDDALAQLAAASANAGPAQLPASGQVVFTRFDGWAASLSTFPDQGRMEEQIREVWSDPQGMLPLEITDGIGSMMHGPKVQTTISAEKPDSSGSGPAMVSDTTPSFSRPTPQWLAQLPTDRTALLQGLRRTTNGGGSSWSSDHQVWSTMNEFYACSDLMLTPQLRVALFRAFGKLHGLQAERMTIGNQQVIGIWHNENGSADEILFDPATGHAVGRRSLYAGDVTLQPAPGQPELDKGVLYQTFYSQRLVSRSDVPH